MTIDMTLSLFPVEAAGSRLLKPQIEPELVVRPGFDPLDSRPTSGDLGSVQFITPTKACDNFMRILKCQNGYPNSLCHLIISHVASYSCSNLVTACPIFGLDPLSQFSTRDSTGSSKVKTDVRHASTFVLLSQ